MTYHRGLVSALTLVLAGGVAHAQTTAAPSAQPTTATPQRQLKLSPKAAPAISALQTAINAKNTATIPGLLSAAQAAAKTPDDRYAIAKLQIQAAADAKDYSAILAGADALRASGAAPAEVSLIYGAVANEAISAKQYGPASAALDRMAAIDPNNTDVMTARAQLLFDQNRASEGVAVLTQAIDRAKAAGQPVPTSWYHVRMAHAFNAKLPNAYNYAREWVAVNPTPANWEQAIGIYRNTKVGDRAALIDLLRLGRATKSLSAESDYAYWAESLLQRGYPAEALSLLNDGVSAGTVKLTSARIAPLQAEAKAKAAGERGALAATAKTALAGPTAALALKAGDGYFDAGDYGQAATLYRAALNKSGADKDLINLHLGMALAMSGDRTGATAALQSAGGNQAETAKYWMTYVSLRS